MNTQNIKDGDVIFWRDDEFEGIDTVRDCNEEGCYAISLGENLSWENVRLLMTKEEFLAKMEQ